MLNVILEKIIPHLFFANKKCTNFEESSNNYGGN
jgi:hypothetical protein